MRDNEAEKGCIETFKPPAEMGSALPAEDDTPLIPGKPGEMPADLAVDRAAGCIAKAGQLKENPRGVEKGVGVGAIDRDTVILTGDTIAAPPAEETTPTPALFLQRSCLIRLVTPVSCFPKEIHDGTSLRYHFIPFPHQDENAKASEQRRDSTYAVQRGAAQRRRQNYRLIWYWNQSADKARTGS